MQTQDGAELCFPQLLNTSCRKPKPRQTEVFLLNFLLIICLFTVTLNLLIIISVSHFRQLHTPTNLLLLSLAVSDLLLGLVITPKEVMRQTICWFLGDLMCVLSNCLSLFVTFVSIGNMVLISVDRYVAICYPLQYSTRVTVKRVQVCVGLLWLCSFVYNSLIMKNDLAQPSRSSSCYGQCMFHLEYTTETVDFFVTFVVPVAVIIVLYMRVFVVAVSQAQAMRSRVTAVTLQRSVTVTAKKSELKAARTLGAVVAVFLICFCPYYCASLAQDDIAAAIIILAGFCVNPCLNPLIYALFYRWFRKAIRLIVTLQILQPNSCETSIQE